MNFKRQSLLTLLAIGALALTAAPDQAEAGIFCGRKCKAKKEALRQAQLQQQQTAAAAYAQPQTTAPAYPQAQPQYQPQYQQPQYQQPQYQQPQTYQPQYQQPQAYQPQYQQPQAYQPQTYQPQTYQPSYSYGRIDYTVGGDQLEQYPNYLQFAQAPYGYTPTPITGAAYDKTPYPVSVNEPEISNLIASTIATGNDIDVGEATVDSGLVKKFYSLRGNQPAFVSSQGPTVQAQIAKQLFTQTAILKGLDPKDYWSADMDSRFNAGAAATSGQKAGLDLLMTQSFIRLAGDLQNGRANIGLIDTHHRLVKKRVFTDFQALNNTLRNPANMVAGLESFEPQHPEYKALLGLMPALLKIQSQGGWAKIAGAKTLKPGIVSADVPLVRQRMVELSILPNTGYVDQSQVYDANLAEAVKIFQENHKLKADGIIGPQGFAVLNIPVEERINQVRATLEKWRWLPRNLGDRYIIVNIARQEMKVVEYGRVVISMRTVNGKLLRPTNILMDVVDKVDLNPFWNPPPNNILADIMPQQRQNPNHMSEERVKIYGQGASVQTVYGTAQVFAKGQEVDPAVINWKAYINSIPSLQFREEPGPTNSLGVVKFNTTNSESIYLHDTNHRELFQENERLFSSGCIRLQHPFQLLQYLLRDQPQYTPQMLNDILSQPNVYTHKEVALTKPIPLYVTYQTVSFDERNQLRFSRDYYGTDSRIIRAITPLDDSL